MTEAGLGALHLDLFRFYLDAVVVGFVHSAIRHPVSSFLIISVNVNDGVVVGQPVHFLQETITQLRRPRVAIAATEYIMKY